MKNSSNQKWTMATWDFKPTGNGVSGTVPETLSTTTTVTANGTNPPSITYSSLPGLLR